MAIDPQSILKAIKQVGDLSDMNAPVFGGIRQVSAKLNGGKLPDYTDSTLPMAQRMNDLTNRTAIGLDTGFVGAKAVPSAISKIEPKPVAEAGLYDVKQQADSLGIKLNILDKKPTKAEMVAGKYRNGEISIYTKKLDGTSKTPEQILSTFNHEVGHHIDYQRRGIVADPMGDSIRGFDGKLRPAADGDIYVRDMTRHGAELKAIRVELPRIDGAANTQKEIFADAYRLYKENPERLKQIAPNVSDDLEKFLQSRVAQPTTGGVPGIPDVPGKPGIPSK